MLPRRVFSRSLLSESTNSTHIGIEAAEPIDWSTETVPKARCQFPDLPVRVWLFG